MGQRAVRVKYYPYRDSTITKLAIAEHGVTTFRPPIYCPWKGQTQLGSPTAYRYTVKNSQEH